MQIKMTVIPQFNLQLSIAQIELLLKLSDQHYDAVCRSYSQRCIGPGTKNGLIRIWHDIQTDWVQQQTTNRSTQPWFNANSRQLDTLLKIMECWHGLMERELDLVTAMRQGFCKALTLSNKVLPGLEWEI